MFPTLICELKATLTNEVKARNLHSLSHWMEDIKQLYCLVQLFNPALFCRLASNPEMPTLIACATGSLLPVMKRRNAAQSG